MLPCLFALAFAEGAFAASTAWQGAAPTNDDCSTAIPVGAGVTTFTNVGATPGMFQMSCGVSATARDIWYSYTAPADGRARISTEGSLAAFGNMADTVMAVYVGSCASGELTEVDCNDNVGTLGPGGFMILRTSTLFVDVTAGTTYLIQIGSRSSDVLSGVLEIELTLPPENDECASAIEIFEGTTAFQMELATPSGDPVSCAIFGDGSATADVWYRYTATTTGAVTVDTIGTPGFFGFPGDTLLAVYEGSCGGLSEIACNDDSGGSTVSELTFPSVTGQSYFIRLLNADTLTTVGVINISTEEALGETICDGVPNSTGVGASLAATGSALASANDLALEVSALPAGTFGVMLASVDSGFVANPGGSLGNLCIGGFNVGRYPVIEASSQGVAMQPVDSAAIPQPFGIGVAAPGDLWNFQLWYRDLVGGTAVSNTSSALQITFE